MIKDKITQAKVNFKTVTGKDARNVYLGRDDMKDLLKWAHENYYIIDIDTAKIEGLHRPEVDGLKCYQVNDDRHIECA